MDDIWTSDAAWTTTEAGRLFVVVWLFILGGVLGSFLNVVVYRLPRKMSLSHPGSRCPACSHPIRWHDNVPILGWLMLGGRCRDCHARISPRYPLVELLIAATSALLGWHEALVPIAGVVDDGTTLYAAQFGVYGFRLLLVYVLFAAALMEVDGNLAPPPMLAAALVVGLAAGVIWPDLRGAPAIGEWQLRGLWEGMFGLLAAILLAALAWPAWMRIANQAELMKALTAATELELVGAFLGVRGVAVVALVSMAMYLGARAAARIWVPLGRFSWTAALGVATLTTIVAWPRIVLAEPRLAEAGDGEVLAWCGAGVAIMTVASRLLPAERRVGQSF